MIKYLSSMMIALALSLSCGICVNVDASREPAAANGSGATLDQKLRKIASTNELKAWEEPNVKNIKRRLNEDNAQEHKEGRYGTRSLYEIGKSTREYMISMEDTELQYYSQAVVIGPKRQEFINRQQLHGADNPEYVICNGDSLESVRKDATGGHKCLIMNFANAFTHGGGFINGAPTQEESICRRSLLYASQSSDESQAMYQRNKANRGACTGGDDEKTIRTKCGLNYMILSPHVKVIRQSDGDKNIDANSTFEVAVMTVAAPDKFKEAKDADKGHIANIMRKQIQDMLTTAAYLGYDTVVLGAWGCGAFGHDAKEVASYFRDVLVTEGLGNNFKKIVFAILNDPAKINKFRKVFPEVGGAGNDVYPMTIFESHADIASVGGLKFVFESKKAWEPCIMIDLGDGRVRNATYGEKKSLFKKLKGNDFNESLGNDLDRVILEIAGKGDFRLYDIKNYAGFKPLGTVKGLNFVLEKTKDGKQYTMVHAGNNKVRNARENEKELLHKKPNGNEYDIKDYADYMPLGTVNGLKFVLEETNDGKQYFMVHTGNHKVRNATHDEKKLLFMGITNEEYSGKDADLGRALFAAIKNNKKFKWQKENKSTGNHGGHNAPNHKKRHHRGGDSDD